MSRYYVLQGVAPGRVVIMSSLRGPGPGDGWMLGRKLNGQVQIPVEVTAKKDYDRGTLMPICPTPTIMRRDLYDAICSAGVDNIDVWPAIVRKADGSILSNQYLAYNVLGAMRVAGGGTVYAPENPSRMVDASIESLEVDDNATHDLLLFRLAESMKVVLVHEVVKAAIEARGIENIAFVSPTDYRG